MNVAALTVSLDPTSGEFVLELVEGQGALDIEVERLADRVRVRVSGLRGPCHSNVAVAPLRACSGMPVSGRDGAWLYVVGLRPATQPGPLLHDA